MSYELEDIDIFLQNIKDKQEVDDYINKGIYPDRLKSKPVIKPIHTCIKRNLYITYYFIH